VAFQFPLPACGESRSWRSYDEIAATLESLAVPHLFTPPARDLVAILKVPDGARVLDVGAGTGVAALLALESAGPGALVVALDCSLGMLRVAQKKGLLWLTAGAVPGLPFPDATFDVVLANFVLSHIAAYQTALVDMARVLRPAGRLGFSSWGPAQSESRSLWQATAESFVGREELRRGLLQALPGEEWFSDPGRAEKALRDAGFENVAVHHREYKMSVPVDDFLQMREITCQARLMQELLEPAQWESFRQQVSKEFHSRCSRTVEDNRDAYLAAGTKPDP